MPNPTDQDLTQVLIDRLGRRPEPFNISPTRTINMDHLATSPGNDQFGDPLPPVAHPPMFRPQTPPVGHTLATLMEQFYKAAPELRGRVGKMGFGPNIGVIDTLSNNEKLGGKRINPVDYDKTNLLGQTSMKTKDVSINPRLMPENMRSMLLSTLAHELTHVSGSYDETDPEASANIMDTLTLHKAWPPDATRNHKP